MTGKRKTVLIVDDSPILITRLRNMLEGADGIGSILHAGNYREAHPLLLTQLPDVVLLDINLPDVNGIEVLRRIKKEHPSLIVIMMSNQAGEFYRSHCKALGANYFIDKSTEFHLTPRIIVSFD